MSIGQPGMNRHHRDFHRKRGKKSKKYQSLGCGPQGELVKLKNIKGPLSNHVQIYQGDQHQQRPQQGIEKELDRGIHPIRPTPDPDYEKHRNQHRLPEQVEQDRVQRAEHPNHQPFHDKKGSEVLRNPLTNYLPARDDDNYGKEGSQEHQRHGDAIDPQRVVHVETFNPRRFFNELHDSSLRIKTTPQRQAQSEDRDRES